MRTAVARRLRVLVLELKDRAWMERNAPGFYRRHPNGPISRRGGGWQYGHEIEGHGTVVGHCKNHRPHKTAAQAADCGSRFEAGLTPRLIDRFRTRHAHWTS